MRVLVVSSSSIHIENFMNLLETCSHNRFEIFICSNTEYIGKYKTDCLIKFKISNPFEAFNSIFVLSQYIRRMEPDIIHVHQANSVAFLTFLSIKFSGIKGIRTVLTSWGSDILILPEKNFLMRKMIMFNLRNAEVITYDATVVKSKIEELNNAFKHKLNFFFYGIELPKVDYSRKENIIYSNRLHKSLYRIDKIIYAFNVFQKKYPDWKLIIAGSGEETEKLKSIVQSLHLENKVSFVGWLSKQENMRYYGRAKIYVSIPISDAGSVSILEALAHKCYSIVSDLPANKEWISSKNGYIVQNVDDNFLAEAYKKGFLEFNPHLSNEKIYLVSKENQCKNITDIYFQLMEKGKDFV